MTDLPLRIAVLGDDDVVGYGLLAMLRPYADRVRVVRVPGHAADEPLDVALYDTVGRARAPELIQRLVGDGSVHRLAVWTWNFRPWLARQCLDAGASAYLSKGLPAHELVQALLNVHDGKQVVAPEPAASVIDAGDWIGREQGLTPREAEVLMLISQGYANAEIADLTCLSINSIKSYIRSCYRKIDVASRSRAVLWGIEHGMGPDGLRPATLES